MQQNKIIKVTSGRSGYETLTRFLWARFGENDFFGLEILNQ